MPRAHSNRVYISCHVFYEHTFPFGRAAAATTSSPWFLLLIEPISKSSSKSDAHSPAVLDAQ